MASGPSGTPGAAGGKFDMAKKHKRHGKRHSKRK